MEAEFKYNFSNNSIKFKLIKEQNEIWMDDYNMDFEHIKIFFLLLRNAIEKFIIDGYTTFVQTILKEEWEIIKHLNWRVRTNESYHAYIIIECDLDKVLDNIGKGLGYCE